MRDAADIIVEQGEALRDAQELLRLAHDEMAELITVYDDVGAEAIGEYVANRAEGLRYLRARIWARLPGDDE